MAIKTNGKRNRTAGHNLERQVAELLRNAGFPHAVTSRSESKKRDDQGIDIMNHDEATNGRLFFNIQCKNSTDRPQYDVLLKALPDIPGTINAIIHKYTIKKGTAFHPRGYFAVLNMLDFINMLAELDRLRKQVPQLLNNDSTD